MGSCGRFAQKRLARMHDQVAFLGRLLLLGFTGSPGRFRLMARLTLEEVYKLAFASLLLVFLIAFLTGFLWSKVWFEKLSNLGGVETMATLLLTIQTLEISPILTSVVVLLCYGAPMTWEVAQMKSEGQFNALAFQGIPPEHFLGAPRMLASVLSFPALIAVFNLSSLLGAYIGGVRYTGNPMWELVYAVSSNSDMEHFIKMVFKCFFVSLTVPFFCFYNACQMPENGLHSHSSKIMRASLGEALFFAVLPSVLITVLYKE